MNENISDWNNILLIGIPVIFSIFKHISNVSITQYPYQYFLYNVENRIQKIQSIITYLNELYNGIIIIPKHDRIECIVNKPYKCIIIYTHIYKSLTDILDSQTLDFNCVGYDGTTIHMTDRFKHIKRGLISKQNDNLTVEDCIQILYYNKLGFRFNINHSNLIVPFDISNNKLHSLSYIYINNQNFINTLSTLSYYFKTLILHANKSDTLHNKYKQIYYYYNTASYHDIIKHTSNYNVYTSNDPIISDMLDNMNDTNNDIMHDTKELASKVNLVIHDNDLNNISNDNIANIKDTTYCDITGRNPLQIAFLTQSIKTILFLYDSNQEIDKIIKIKGSHLLLKYDSLDLVDLLEETDYFDKDEFNIQSCYYSLLFGKCNILMKQFNQIKKKLDLSELLLLSIASHKTNMAIHLIKNNFNVDHNIFNSPLLHLCIQYENIKLFNYLMNNDVDISKENINNLTPIRFIIRLMNDNITEVKKKMFICLLEKKIDITADFFIEELVDVTTTYIIDTVISKYSDKLDSTHYDILINKIDEKLDTIQQTDFTFNFSENNYCMLNNDQDSLFEMLNYTKKLVEINNPTKSPIKKDKKITYYFTTFTGTRITNITQKNKYIDLFTSIWNNNLEQFKLLLLDNKLDIDVCASNSNRTLLNVCFEKDAVEIFKFIMELINISFKNKHTQHNFIMHLFITNDIENNLISYGIRKKALNCLNFLLNSDNPLMNNVVKLCLKHPLKLLKQALINDNIDVVLYIFKNTDVISMLPLNLSDNAFNELHIHDDNLVMDCIQNYSIKSLYFLLKKIHTLDLLPINGISNLFNINFTDKHNMNYMHHLCNNTTINSNICNVFNLLHKLDNTLINQKDNYHKTPLFYACNSNNLQFIKCLLDAGADINIHDNKGWYPIHYIIYNKTDVNINKIDLFTDINILNKKTIYEKYTPIILAAKANIPEYVFKLMKLKVNIRCKDILGNMYCHYLMYNGSYCIRNMKNKHCENNFGLTPIECLETRIKYEIHKNNYDMLSKLIRYYDIYNRLNTDNTERILIKTNSVTIMNQNISILLRSDKYNIIQDLVLPTFV